MTGIRESFVFALEDTFGDGKATNKPWIAPPPGSFFNSGHNRQATKIYTVGSKFFDTVAYGQLNGTFNWTFVFDYYYLEPLQLVFERTGVTPADDGIHFTHTFEKYNNTRVPSFTVRRKILNEMAGGPQYSDEITELRGCVVRNISFSKASGTSQLQVTMTGFYTDERMYKGDLDATDYKEYSGKLSEYMCMFVGSISDDHYVANTESLEFSIENNSDAIYNTCSPFAKLYYEGRTNCTFGTTCYSNNPSNYKQRVYSGGFDDKQLRPLAKGLKPIPLITLAAYDKSIRDDDYWDIVNYETALTQSDESMTVTLTDVVIKSLTWPKGNDQKLQDTISSAECRNIRLDIVNTLNDTKVDDMRYNASNTVPSLGYGIVLLDPEGNQPNPYALISVSSDGNVQVIPDALPTNVATTTGGTFVGWFTTAAGPSTESAAGVQYSAGDQITQNLTFYARWTHQLVFNANGGKYTDYPVYEQYNTFTTVGDYVGYYVDYDNAKTLVTNDNKSSLDITAGTTVAYTKVESTSKTLTTDSVTSALTQESIATLASIAKDNYTLDGWYPNADGSGVKFNASDLIRTNMVLYAKWVPNTYQLTLNKGTGGTENGSAIATYDSAILSELKNATKTGSTLSGYYTSASDGTKVINADGTLVANVTDYTGANGIWIRASNTTLYAVWNT